MTRHTTASRCRVDPVIAGTGGALRPGPALGRRLSPSGDITPPGSAFADQAPSPWAIRDGSPTAMARGGWCDSPPPVDRPRVRQPVLAIAVGQRRRTAREPPRRKPRGARDRGAGCPAHAAPWPERDEVQGASLSPVGPGAFLPGPDHVRVERRVRAAVGDEEGPTPERAGQRHGVPPARGRAAEHGVGRQPHRPRRARMPHRPPAGRPGHGAGATGGTDAGRAEPARGRRRRP